jgi:hypothetical protein
MRFYAFLSSGPKPSGHAFWQFQNQRLLMAPFSPPEDPSPPFRDPVVGSSSASGDIALECDFEHFIPLDLSRQDTPSGYSYFGPRAGGAARLPEETSP